ncbi:8351_t:CDS:1, partial [Dentiscutata erythropus]
MYLEPGRYYYRDLYEEIKYDSTNMANFIISNLVRNPNEVITKKAYYWKLLLVNYPDLSKNELKHLANIFDKNNKKRKRKQCDLKLRKVYSNLLILSEYEKIKQSEIYHRVEYTHKEYLKDWHNKHDNERELFLKKAEANNL